MEHLEIQLFTPADLAYLAKCLRGGGESPRRPPTMGDDKDITYAQLRDALRDAPPIVRELLGVKPQPARAAPVSRPATPPQEIPIMPTFTRKLTAEEPAALDTAAGAANGHAPEPTPEPAPASKPKRGRPKKQPAPASKPKRGRPKKQPAPEPEELLPFETAPQRGGPTDDPELQALREDFYPEAYAPAPAPGGLATSEEATDIAAKYAELCLDRIDTQAEIEALTAELARSRLARELLLDQLTGLAYDWLAATRGSDLWMKRYGEIADALTDAIEQRNSAEETVRRLAREQPAPRTLTITVNL